MPAWQPDLFDFVVKVILGMSGKSRVVVRVVLFQRITPPLLEEIFVFAWMQRASKSRLLVEEIGVGLVDEVVSQLVDAHGEVDVVKCHPESFFESADFPKDLGANH